MPLSYSPEQTYVLTLFDVVLSGLALTLLVWMRVGTRSQRLHSPLFAASFLLYAVAFGLFAAFCREAFGDPGSAGASTLFLASDLLRLVAAVTFGSALLLQAGRRRPAIVLAVAAVLLVLVAIGRWSADRHAVGATIAPITSARAGEALVLLVVSFLTGRRNVRAASGAALLGISRALPLASPFAPGLLEAAWAVEHLATIVALIVLCFAIEARSVQTSVRFFLRLNLTFVVLATSVIVALGAVERHELIDVSTVQLQDLAEYIRGDLLTRRAHGIVADDAFASGDLVHNLVADFGRYPDLRRIHVALGSSNMTLSIDDSGEISRVAWRGERVLRPRVSIRDFEIAPVVAFPIVAAGHRVGAVALDYSLRQINARIGRQMQLIFVAFTVFVAVASVATGMLVVGAERTIREQFDELERTRRRLTINERLASIGSVAGGVAHELNNPAGILVARTDLLLSGLEEPTATVPAIREDLETIRRQAQRIARTVKDLLTFSRPVEPAREPFDVREVLESAVALVQPLVAGRDIAVQRAYADRVPAAWGDRSRVEQVFTNVLANAIQAIDGSGVVTVATGRVPAGVAVYIRDTGCGIPAADLDRIFDPFFSTKGPGRGTGLGLSIAFGIIRDHGGTIDVTSRPASGSEFRIVLPAVPVTGGLE